MELTNIRYIKDRHEVVLYFKDHSITAPATWQTYNVYCEFHNIAIDRRELMPIEINTIKWNGNFSELIAL
jgi:hypothetical protein